MIFFVLLLSTPAIADENCPIYMRKEISLDYYEFPSPSQGREIQLTKFEEDLSKVYPQLVRVRESLDGNSRESQQPAKSIKKWIVKVAKSSAEIYLLHLQSTYSVAQRWRISEHNNRSIPCSPSHTGFDITEIEPRQGDWYIICVRHNFISDAVLTSCYQCALVQAGSPTSRIAVRLADSTATEAKLFYDVTNYPLTTSKVRTVAEEMSPLKRCSTSISNTAQTSESEVSSVKNPILPNAVTEAVVEGLSPKKAYNIRSELVLNFPEAYAKMAIPDTVDITCNIFDQPILTIPRACEDRSYEYKRQIGELLSIPSQDARIRLRTSPEL